MVPSDDRGLTLHAPPPTYMCAELVYYMSLTELRLRTFLDYRELEGGICYDGIKCLRDKHILIMSVCLSFCVFLSLCICVCVCVCVCESYDNLLLRQNP